MLYIVTKKNLIKNEEIKKCLPYKTYKDKIHILIHF